MASHNPKQLNARTLSKQSPWSYMLYSRSSLADFVCQMINLSFDLLFKIGFLRYNTVKHLNVRSFLWILNYFFFLKRTIISTPHWYAKKLKKGSRFHLFLLFLAKAIFLIAFLTAFTLALGWMAIPMNSSTADWAYWRSWGYSEQLICICSFSQSTVQSQTEARLV